MQTILRILTLSYILLWVISMFSIKNEVTPITKEPAKKPFSCFAVNEEGLVAIGYENYAFPTVITICIYSSDGAFQQGYTLNWEQSIGLELYQNTLNIYCSKADMIISVDLTTNEQTSFEIPDDLDNNKHWNYVYRKTKTTVNNKEYVAEKNTFLGILTLRFSDLVVRDENNNEFVVYDASERHQWRTMITSVCFVTAFFVALFGGIRARRNYMKNGYKGRGRLR